MDMGRSMATPASSNPEPARYTELLSDGLAPALHPKALSSLDLLVQLSIYNPLYADRGIAKGST